MIWKWIKLLAVVLLIAISLFFVVKSEYKLNKNFGSASPFMQNHQFRLGLDLSGGSHLVYQADLSEIGDADVKDLMEALRGVIERRVNLFGVSEPIVQVQSGNIFSGGEERLIVDLPGVTDLEEATRMIGETPLLEFKTVVPEGTLQQVTVDENGQEVFNLEDQFVSTDLTGRYLKRASLVFDPNTGEPLVSLLFDDVGKELFAQITRENVGEIVAIYLDSEIISAPVVQEEITAGEAIISGSMTAEEAKILVGRLNSGSLPVPITLLSTQTIGATLGEEAVTSGVKSAVIGFILISIFLIFWYRLPGFVAVISLLVFVLLVLAFFKLIPVTLTAAGIAGFIISMGLAVDANVLVSERIKEEMRSGKSVKEAVSLGFARAWLSIRDSNTSSLITAAILFWFGTSLIKGFALTLGVGVIVSLFTASSLTKLFLTLFASMPENKFTRFLFSNGLTK